MNDALGIGIRYEGPEKLTAIIGECVRRHALEFCDVSGFGELQWIELESTGKGGKRHFSGPFQLVSLRGRLRVAGEVLISDFMCTVARDTDNGIQLLGGVLTEAEIGYLELTFSPLAASEIGQPASDTRSYGKPLVEGSELDNKAETEQMGTWREPGQAASKKKSGDLDERWTQAIAESNRIRKTAGDEEGDTLDERPELGDVIMHRQFGRCTVTRIGDSHITLRKPDSRQVQLGLSILKFTRDEDDEDGKPVYSVTVRPRR